MQLHSSELSTEPRVEFSATTVAHFCLQTEYFFSLDAGLILW